MHNVISYKDSDTSHNFRLHGYQSEKPSLHGRSRPANFVKRKTYQSKIAAKHITNVQLGDIEIQIIPKHEFKYGTNLDFGAPAAENFEIIYAPGGFDAEKQLVQVHNKSPNIFFNKTSAENIIKLIIPKHKIENASPFFNEMVQQTKGGNLNLNDLACDYIQNYLLLNREIIEDGNEITQRCVGDHLVGLIVSSLEIEARSNITMKSQSTNKLLGRIKAYIKENLTDSDITPLKIAAECGISVSYLHKLFKVSGTPVTRWILQRRLELCKKLLLEPGYNHILISSIAYDVGFNNQAHFSSKFKAYFGISPREIRLQALAPVL